MGPETTTTVNPTTTATGTGEVVEGGWVSRGRRVRKEGGEGGWVSRGRRVDKSRKEGG